jgi:hypothetical protein
LEAVVEWTRTGWLAKLNDSEKWIWCQPAADLKSGKSVVVDEAAKRAGLDPQDIERLRRELSWQDRGYPPRDPHSFKEADLPEAPGEWERYVLISWRRSDHPHRGELYSRVSQRFVEVMREPVHRSTFVSRLLNELYERIDHWDATVEEARTRPLSPPDRLGAQPKIVDPEPMKAERGQRLAAAQERWRPITQRKIPFSWIHAAAGVDHKDAYTWKRGKLPDTSVMAKSIERVLREPNPPAAPITE